MEKRTWSVKEILMDMNSNNTLINHAVSEENIDDEFVAFNSSFCKSTPTFCKIDTNACTIGVDTYVFRCISPFIDDFVGSLCPLITSKSVKIFRQGNDLHNTMIGTIWWNFQDDKGVTRIFLIKDSLLDPDGLMRLLPPQHFAEHFESEEVTADNTRAIQ